MNTHKHARLTYLRRLEMVQDIAERGVSAAQAGRQHGVSAVTARKWLGRYLADGAAGLMDKSSRPARSPRSIDPSVALTIVELRRKMFLQSRIASYMGVSKATVSRVLRRAGLSRLSDLQPDEPVQRYERDVPGELLHVGADRNVSHRVRTVARHCVTAFRWGCMTRSIRLIVALVVTCSASVSTIGTKRSPPAGWSLTLTTQRRTPPLRASSWQGFWPRDAGPRRRRSRPSPGSRQAIGP